MSNNFWQWWTGGAPNYRRYWDHDLIAWLYGQFQNLGWSDNGISGLFGNLYQESGICPYKCEGIAIVQAALDYTIQFIRPATRAQFVSQSDPAGRYPDGTGYSLAQWSYTRKGDFYDFGSWSQIGTEYQMYRDGSFLIQDLRNHPDTVSVSEAIWSAQGKTVWQWLSDPNVSLSDAVDAVLMLFEKPFQTLPVPYADYQAEHNKRYTFAEDVMRDFAGVTPPPTPPIPPDPPVPPVTADLPIWLYFKLKEGGLMDGRPKYDTK